jgi:MFS family permease
MDESPAVRADRTPVAAGSQRTWGLVSDRRLLIGLYILVAFLYWMSLYLYAPTLPSYAQSMTGSLALVGVILAQYGLWQAVIRLPLGIAADWLGRRKPFIVIGLILAGLGAWTMGTAASTQGLLVGRAITGLAAGTWVPLLVLFSSLFPAHQAVQATSILSAVGSVGRVTATSVTGSLNKLGGYSLAYCLAAIAAVLALLFVLPARENARPRRRPSMARLGTLITRRDVLVPSLLGAVLQYVVWAVAFGFMPLLAERLGATDVTQSMLMSLHIALVTLGSLVATAAVNRIGALHLVYGTLALLVVGTGMVTFAPSLALVFAAQFLLGLSRGLGYPVLMGLSIQDVDDAERTTAMGLHQSVYAIGMFTGPWLSGLVADAIGIRPMFAVTAFGCLVVGLSLIRLLPQERARDGQSQ